MRSNSLNLAVLFLTCFVVIGLPFILVGFPDGSDEITHLRFAVAYRDAVETGRVLPGWMMDNGGLGGVGVRFYPPLASITTVAFELLTGSWYSAFCINIFVWMYIGCVGVYLLVRLWAPPQLALYAGLLFAVVPHHLNQIYQYLLYAEFIGLSILPFCFYFLTRLLREPNFRDSLLLSVSCSLLILSHIPLSIIGSISLAVYAVPLIERAKIAVVAERLLFAVALTVASTAFFWVRVLSELDWVAHAKPEFTSGHYSYANWLFPTVYGDHEQFILVLSARLFDGAIVLSALFLLPAVVYLIASKTRAWHRDRGLAAMTLAGIFSFFMISRASEFVWRLVPVLQQIQFPWRWLSPLSVLGVSSFALAIYAFVRDGGKLVRPVVYAGILIVLASLIYDWTQTIVWAGGQTRSEFQHRIDNLMEPPFAEYWRPVWAKEAALLNRSQVSIDGRDPDIETWETETRKFTISEGKAGQARIGTYYYPHWRAEVNNIPTTVEINKEGVMIVAIPAERSEVTLHFDEPARNVMALFVSVSSWFVTLFLLFWSMRRRANP